MNAKIASVLLTLAFAATAANAQQGINERVAQAMPGKYAQPACELKSNHFKVSSGATYLKTGTENEIPENRARVLENGQRVLLEAIQQNGQADNPAAWYYLGRVYIQQGDVRGADSAFARAEKGAPQCAEDILNYRRIAWVTLVNSGSQFEEQKNVDSALAMYRLAAAIYPRSPRALYAVASILNEKGQVDSAAAYFGRAAATGEGLTDTAEVKFRNRSAFNAAALHLNAKQYPQAVTAFEQYLKWEPNDTEAKRGLATAYRETGQTAKAQALEEEILASGGGAASAGGPAGGAGAQDLMNIGVNFYNDKKYAEAAEAFEKVSAAEPYNRDVLFNLTNTYLALKDGPKLLSAAQRLAAIEPLSETALKLVGEGHKQSKQVDEAVKAAEQVLALPVDVKVTNFTPTANGATLTATATGREAQTPAGKPIKPAPVGLTVEFLDAQGTVVATQDAQVPALEPGATHEIQAAGQGSGIVAWRYKRK